MPARHQEGSFIRWQTVARTQLSYANNLILGLTVAALGFQVTLLLNTDVDFNAPSEVFAFWALVLSMLMLLLSVGIGIWLVINRLRSFRASMQVARAMEQAADGPDTERLRKISNRLDARSWRLIWAQIGAFGLGVFLAVIGVVMLAIHFFVTAGMPDMGCDI